MKRLLPTLLICLLITACSSPVTQVNTATARLSCTPTGDNGSTGCASVYDLRWGYDSAAIANITNWPSMNQVTEEPMPRCAALSVKDTFNVSGLPGDTVLFFCVRIGDEIPNWSALSNVKRVRTADNIAPAPVIDLNEVK